jgi:hypothetical protein
VSRVFLEFQRLGVTVSCTVQLLTRTWQGRGLSEVTISEYGKDYINKTEPKRLEMNLILLLLHCFIQITTVHDSQNHGFL